MKIILMVMIIFFNVVSISFAQESTSRASWLPANVDVEKILINKKMNKQTNCRFITVFTKTNDRLEYIQRSSDKNPILYYVHQRVIYPILGNLERLVLIDDFPATKTSNIYVVDLKTGRKWSIDTRVYDRTNQKIDTDNFMVFAKPVGFSPDDTKVLVKMPIGYVMHTGKESEKAVNEYGNPSYVIDSKTGNTLHEYSKENIPEKWWVY